MKSLRLYVFALVLLTIAGCALPQPTVSPLVVTSPLNALSASPLVTPAALPQGPRFTITLPVKAGDTVLRGAGKAGVPVRVVNVTQSASELGNGKIGANGKFEIRLSQPLVAGERVGLMLGDLGGTSFQKTDFLSGPGYQDIPLIGTVFTTTLISP